MPPLDAALAAPCDRPERHLTAGDWEIMAGRLGDALILCASKHAAIVARDTDLREAMK